MTKPTGRHTPNGLEFGPTKSGKVYLCYKEHRKAGSRLHKSQWDVSHVEEYELFCRSDDNDWFDSNNDYWIVEPNGQPLGKKQERVAKFWDRMPWHGFPVLTGETSPPKDLVKKWKSDGIISRRLEKIILQGRI